MSKVFISYRREDSAGYAGRLYDRLVQHFGEDRVFMDLEIEPGDDFVERIERNVDACEVFLVLIGKHWLTSEGPDGNRRLDNPDDFPRIELAAALDRGVRVIPVLLGGAPMPGSQELPPDLAKLSRRQALDLSDVRFTADFERLVRTIERELAKAEEAKGAATVPQPTDYLPSNSPNPDEEMAGRRKNKRSLGNDAPFETESDARAAGEDKGDEPEPTDADGLARSDRALRRTINIGGICGLVLVLAPFMVPVDAYDTRLLGGDVKYQIWGWVTVLIGLTLSFGLLHLRMSFGPKTRFFAAGFLLLAGSFVLTLVGYVRIWHQLAGPQTLLWAALGLTMLGAASNGLQVLGRFSRSIRSDIPPLVAAVGGVLLVVASVFVPVERWGAPPIKSDVLYGFVGVGVGIAMMIGGGMRLKRPFFRPEAQFFVTGLCTLAATFVLFAVGIVLVGQYEVGPPTFLWAVLGLVTFAAALASFREIQPGQTTEL